MVVVGSGKQAKPITLADNSPPVVLLDENGDQYVPE